MKKSKKKGFRGVLWALLLAAELAVLADLIAAACERPLPPVPWMIGAGLLFLLLCLLPLSRRRLREDVIGLLLLGAIAILGARGLLFYFGQTRGYTAIDNGKGALFADRRVLIAAPRRSAEESLAGGVADEYSRYGSEVWLFDEEEQSLRSFGGGAARPAELGAALRELRPTVVIASAEAGAAGSSLSAALAALPEGERPLVLYGTPDAGASDFYGENLRSTQKPDDTDEALWERRLRLPVSPGALSRSLPACAVYRRLEGDAAEKRRLAETVIKGDRCYLTDAPETALPGFVKISDSAGNFLYDYYIDPRGKESFTLFTCGDAADQIYTLSYEGVHCVVTQREGGLDVTCPRGRTCIITVTSGDRRYWDTIIVSNPGRFYRETAQSLERFILTVGERLPASNTLRLTSDLLPKLPFPGR